jgi:hypothetical protein
MPASKSMKIKSVRYNAIVSRPNLAEKNNLFEKPQARSEDESNIRKQELIMMARVIEDAIKQKKEVCYLFDIKLKYTCINNIIITHV